MGGTFRPVDVDGDRRLSGGYAFALNPETVEAKEAAKKKRETKRPQFVLGIGVGSTTIASLAEYSNPDDYVEFHWNPSQYSISKSAKWSEKSSSGGTPTLEFSGTGLMTVNFSVLFNDMAVRRERAARMSTEDSLEWLIRRTRSRTKSEASHRGSRRKRNPGWINRTTFGATEAPPVLVLFGVSSYFICVLESVKITTIFQGEPSAAFDASDGLKRFKARHGAASIKRAKVDLVLKEYAFDSVTSQTERKGASSSIVKKG